MGLFKGIKDMKSMVSAAPGLMDQANQLSTNSQALQAQALQAQATAPAHGGFGAPAPVDGDLPDGLDEPIAGVDLRTYSQVSAGLADYGYDQSKAVDIAASRGIDAANWQLAFDGWNDRIAQNPAVARKFNAFYTGRA